MAAIEIVDDRYVDYGTLGAPTLIATDFFGAGCVLRPAVPGFDPFCLRHDARDDPHWTSRVGSGGERHSGRALKRWCGLGQQPRGARHHLRRGESWLLGSLVQTQWWRAGQSVGTDDRLGTASVDFSELDGRCVVNWLNDFNSGRCQGV